MDSPPLFHHLHHPSPTSDKTWVLLHGTGADEHDLIPLARELNPDFGILALRGNVDENGLTRFFKRFDAHTYDQKNMQEETDKLHQFLIHFPNTQNPPPNTKSLNPADLVFLGYSNGSNMILSLLFRHPEDVHTALLFHPMTPFVPDPELDLSQTKLLLTSGLQDPYLRTPDEIEQLDALLQARGANVTRHQHPGGHELRHDEIEAAHQFLAHQST